MLGMLLWGIGASMALAEENEKAKTKSKKEKLKQAKKLLNEFMRISEACTEEFEPEYTELISETENFLKEVEL